MKTSTLNSVLVVLKDFRIKANSSVFTELVEYRDQKYGTDTFGQFVSLEKELKNLSFWAKTFSKLESCQQKAEKLKVVCHHFEELVRLLQGFDSLSEMKDKVQNLAQNIFYFKQSTWQENSQTTLNAFRLELRKVLDTASQFGLTEQDLGLFQKEKERDWTTTLITTA